MEPVATSRRSYSAVLPSSAITRRLTRSMAITLRPVCSVMPCSEYHDSGLRMISSIVCSPASTGDSRMRL